MCIPFVVLLRAVQRATPVLYNHSYSTEVTTVADAQRTKLLVRRLLDSHILHSCSDVFSAFDESLLFGDAAQPSTVQTLKTSFRVSFRTSVPFLIASHAKSANSMGRWPFLGSGRP